MADNDHSQHISTQILERFSMRNLPEAELSTISEHVSECSACGAEFVSTLKRQRGESELSFTLAPEFWLRHGHLDYAQLVDLAENKLDGVDRELIDAHLRGCQVCQEDVTSFLAFREQIAPELRVSYAPVQETREHKTSFVSWWSVLTQKPSYSVATALVVIILAVGAIFLLNRRKTNQQAQVPTPQISPGSTPALATNLPSPTTSPNQSSIEQPNGSEAMVVLYDRGRTITVDRRGNLSGLDDISRPARNEIAQALSSGTIERPTILKELSGANNVLRGESAGQPFKLIAPRRAVIVSNRPTFRWESVTGATAYTVYVNDSNGQIPAKSDALAPSRTEWISSKPFKRGEVYAWIVTAVVDGKEVISPGPSAPEMKFQILSAANLAKLNQLSRVRSHFALAVFYCQVGMVAEAETELEILVKLNPDAPQVRKLLTQIRSLRPR